MRSETSGVYAQPNGNLEMRSTALPTRVEKADGSWAKVDTTLALGTDGSVRPAASTVDVAFSGGGDGPLVQLAEDGHEVSVDLAAGLDTALPKPVLSGDTATYPNVLPGVDLKLTADAIGFSQVLVVKTAQAAANPALDELQFEIGGDDLTVTNDAQDSLKVVDEKGKAVFVGGTPQMWDSSDAAPGPGTPAVDGPSESAHRIGMDTETVGDGTVRVTPDEALLTAPTTKYPVYIDPGMTVNKFLWTFVDSGNPNTSYYNSSDIARVGTFNAGANKYRSWFGMATAPLTGARIISANFVINETYSGSCTAREVQLWGSNEITAATTWNNQAAWLTKDATLTAAKGYSSACAAGTLSFPITGLVQRAADGGWGGLSLGLRAASETDNSYGKKFSNNPVLNVTYNFKPGTPEIVSGQPCYRACPPQAPNLVVGSATPTFTTRATDVDAGQQVRIQYEILNEAQTAQVTTGTTAYGASGQYLPWTPTTPLANMGSYYIHARAFDGTDYGPWSAAEPFSVDTRVPPTPTLSSADYPAGAWSGSAGEPGEFDLHGDRFQTAEFVYGLDENPPTRIADAHGSGEATLTLAPDAGPHTLYVRARSYTGIDGPLTTHTFNVGSGALTSPSDGEVISNGATQITVDAPTQATSYALQWRRGDTDVWADIPAGDLTVPGRPGAAPTTRDANGNFAAPVWNAAATLNNAESGPYALPGPLQLRAVFTGGPANATDEIYLSFDQQILGAATEDVGPGDVDLVTGNFSFTDTDTTIDSYGTDLSFTRTYNSRQNTAADPTGMFGPGWTSSANTGDSAYTGVTAYGSLVQVGTADGDSIGFTAKTTQGSITSYTPEPGAETLTLTFDSAASRYTLADTSGTATTFTQPAGSSLYTPASITHSGQNQSTVYSWETVAVNAVAVTRPTRLLAPVPAGVTCGTGVTGLARGCRALSFTYATSTTATSATPGDYTGRVTAVQFTAWDPATAAMKTLTVTRYGYDTTGKLVQTWDPRLDYTQDGTTKHLADTYTYGDSQLLTGLTPAGQQPWTLTYSTIPGDSGKGRLVQVHRSALTAGTATTTVVYNVPVTGTGAPYNLSESQTIRWGQEMAPTTATAVFPATQVPSANQSTGTLPSSYTKATITYLDTSGRAINTAAPGGYITATRYDRSGNITMTLTAANRQRALDTNPSDSWTTEATLANRYATLNTYEADGRRVKETFGPEHHAAIPTGDGGWTTQRAREHTVYTYDQGAPGAGGPYDLVTKQVTTARLANGTDADPRTTTTSYDWTLRKPTAITTDPDGLNLTTRTTYDTTTGLVTSVTAPAGGTSTDTPRTRRSIYYTAGANENSDCGNHPEWANLVCQTRAGGGVEGGADIPTTTTTYNQLNQPAVTVETGPGETVLRTTTLTYDTAGRAVLTRVVGGDGSGEPIPATRTVYDPVTSQVTRTQSLNTSDAVTAEVVRAYDALGRSTSYTDADGVTSTTTYDILSRPASTNDGKATQTYSYDTATNENRGVLTQIVDSQAGTFNAAYNPDGQRVYQQLPNGLIQTSGYDETGDATFLEYAQPGCADGNSCLLLQEWAVDTIHGQRTGHGTAFSEQYESYDAAGRLFKTEDIHGGGCTIRTYNFDDASNRTALATYNPADDGACQNDAPASDVNWAYDNADRTTNDGYTYDALGRTLAVPSNDTQNRAGSLTIGYHTSDLVRSITQGNRSTVYSLDVINERVRGWTDSNSGTSTTHTNHYGRDSDSPSWVQEDATTYGRNISAFAGVAARYSSASNTVSFPIANLHGDLIADTAANLQSNPGVLGVYETTEYGTSRAAGQTQPRYSYLGSHQRAADNPTGIILMGVRLYNPSTGRFLSTDTVSGGSCNSYDYGCGDPTNKFDLDGRALVGKGYKNQCLSAGCISLQSLCNTTGEKSCSIQWGAWLRGVWRTAIAVNMFYTISINGVRVVNNAWYGHTAVGSYTWHSQWGAPNKGGARGKYKNWWIVDHLRRGDSVSMSFKGTLILPGGQTGWIAGGGKWVI